MGERNVRQWSGTPMGLTRNERQMVDQCMCMYVCGIGKLKFKNWKLLDATYIYLMTPSAIPARQLTERMLNAVNTLGKAEGNC